MATIFSEPLSLAQHVIGPIIDQRYVVLYAQPEADVDQLLSAANLAGDYTTIESSTRATIQAFINKNPLVELFTGTPVKYLSNINGYNAFGISYMSAEVQHTSDLCEHPIENGTKITDAAIINPTTATVRITMPTAFYTRIYDQIERMFRAKDKIILQTKFGLIKDMVIKSLPYRQENGTIDRPEIELQLQQVIQVAPETISVNISPSTSLDAGDSDTTNYGRQYANLIVDSLERDKVRENVQNTTI